MLGLAISSVKKDSAMHKKKQWNMSQNCEQTGEDVVSADGGAAPYSDRGLKRKNRSKSGFYVWSVIEDNSPLRGSPYGPLLTQRSLASLESNLYPRRVSSSWALNAKTALRAVFMSGR